jgi:ribosome-associated protein
VQVGGFMEEVRISTEYIKLDQFLKWAGAVDNGAMAKGFILDGFVKVNGNIEIQRGKKLRNGDIVEFEDKKYQVVQK